MSTEIQTTTEQPRPRHLKIYLRVDGLWQPFEGDLTEELKKREIKIHDGASVGAWASVGDRASVGAWARVGAWASVGDGARVGDGVSVGDGASVGAWASVGDGARVGDGAQISCTADCILIGPIGSRSEMLTGYVSEGVIHCATGCFCGTIDQFEEAVRETHGDNEHGQAYGLAIGFLRLKLARTADDAPTTAEAAQ